MTELSADGLKAALSGWTEEVFLECLTFEHEDLSAPIRLVNDRQDLTRGANTFTAFPFSVQLHRRTDDSLAQAVINADGVDQRLVSALRSILEPRPTVKYEVVLASSPTVVEQGPMDFEITGFSLPGPAMIQIQVSFALDFLNQAFPKDYFAPWNSGT